MEKTLPEVIQEYKEFKRRLHLNLVNNLIPAGTPVLVSYGGVYEKFPRCTRWISGTVAGHWGDRPIFTKVRVNAKEWDENRIYHHCNLSFTPETDPTKEVVIKVSRHCVQVDRTVLCRLTDRPHHPDFAGNALPWRFLLNHLCEYNRQLTKKPG